MLIDDKLLDKVTEQAKASEHLSMNYNLYDSLKANAQATKCTGTCNNTACTSPPPHGGNLYGDTGKHQGYVL